MTSDSGAPQRPLWLRLLKGFAVALGIITLAVIAVLLQQVWESLSTPLNAAGINQPLDLLRVSVMVPLVEQWLGTNSALRRVMAGFFILFWAMVAWGAFFSFTLWWKDRASRSESL